MKAVPLRFVHEDDGVPILENLGFHVPRVGDGIGFRGVAYYVVRVFWHYDEDESLNHVTINLQEVGW